jgi:hypothetical protein
MNRSSDAADDERQRVAAEVASRLRRRGIQLSGSESAVDLADLEEAVDEFERAVERSGGDLMVDEPVAGESPIAPDEATFVLPVRKANESVASFIGRVSDATERITSR